MRVPLLALVASLGLAAPAAAVTFTVDLDDLEGSYVDLVTEKSQTVGFSPTQSFRLFSLTLEVEGTAVCSLAPCDPPPSFRFELGLGTFLNLGPYADSFDESVVVTPFRPPFFLPGESLELALTLGRFPDSGQLIPVPSSPTDLTRVAVAFTGDFFPVSEPGAGLLVLAALAGQAPFHRLARGARWRRGGGPIR
jgi:hypothetical protein